MAASIPSNRDDLLMPAAKQATYAKNRAGDIHYRPVKFGNR